MLVVMRFTISEDWRDVKIFAVIVDYLEKIEKFWYYGGLWRIKMLIDSHRF